MALLAVLLAALAMRLWYFETPLIDAHSWRQVTNADIARHFAEGAGFFRPQVSWGGADGVVGMEFPLLQWLTGAIWRATWESYEMARLVTIAFSMAGVVCVFGLGARLFGRPAGLAAALLMAFAPGIVFFGRSFLSDTPMLTFMIAAVWAWDVYFERPTTSGAVWAALFTALAALVKLPAILVLAPIAGTGWRHQRWAVVRSPGAWGGLTAAVLATIAWYWHADRIFLETGLTQAVFRPSGTYPANVAPGVAFTTVSHWATASRLLSSEFWIEIGDRFWVLHLTAVGAIGAVYGWMRMRTLSGCVVVDLWALAGLAFVIVAAEGQYWHEFHQLPVLAPFLLAFGVGVGPIFDREWRARNLPAVWGTPLLALLVATAAVQSVRASGVERHLYRPDNLQSDIVAAGAAIREATEPGALVMTVEYKESGVNSPMLLYFAHRQGWSFDTYSASQAEIEWLETHLAARYFATNEWDVLLHDRPEVAAFVAATYKEVALVDQPATLRLFDLARHR
ncbi:MAG: glycosyltransferase family 39 protein [Acidobacteriota bacterium]